MFCIVREFLEFFKLKYTVTVYEPESYGENRYKYEGKEKIIKDLGLTNLDENAKVPLLWQLLKIAQMKTKSTIEINLNVNNNNNHVTEESIKETISNTSNNKTESIKNSIKTEENCSSEKLPTLNNNIEKNEQFNATFIVSEQIDEQNDATNSKTDNYKDDTYDDTSSIAEDGNNFDKIDNDMEIHTKSSTDDEILEFSPPIVKDKSKNENSDKSKSAQKQDKLKKGTLSDLPPLPITKPHVNDILPSLYSKELKEKSNLRELNKLFDIEQEYEEDFMSSSSIDLSLQSTNHSNGVDSKISTETNNSIQRNLKTSPNNGEIDELTTSTQ